MFGDQFLDEPADVRIEVPGAELVRSQQVLLEQQAKVLGIGAEA